MPAFRDMDRLLLSSAYPLLRYSNCQLQSTLYDDPDEFSMICFHPYELKWEGHALDGDENRVLKRASLNLTAT